MTPRLPPGRTALLLLDLQRDMMDADGVYARHGFPVDRLRHVVPVVCRVAEASRARGVPIFASKFTVFTSPSGRPLGLEQLARTRPFLAREGFRVGDRGRELIAGLPTPDYSLDKPRFSAFHGTSLELLLSALEIRTIVLTGIVSGGAVESTARDAVLRGLSVVVLEDGLAGLDEDVDARGLVLAGSDVAVMDSASYVRALEA
ncbi:MAG: cysteine hydrolase family protein [Candidatus Rokuibacteriota bacterium]